MVVYPGGISISFHAALSSVKYKDPSNHVTYSSFHPLLYLTANLLSLSATMVSWVLFPQGKQIQDLLPLTITKMLESWVEKPLPLASFTRNMSNNQGVFCRSSHQFFPG